MSRPRFPTGVVLPVEAIRRIREKQESYDRDPARAEREQARHKQEWSLDACVERGCLPTGEPIEYLFGQGPWSKLS